MINILKSVSAQTSLASVGFAIVMMGIVSTAIGGAMAKRPSLGASSRLACELRITATDGTRQTIARGREGEACVDLAARISNDRIPRDYRALWFELVPEE